MDALQADIDALEKEKVELKKRLDLLSKKTLLQDLARQSTSGIGAIVVGINNLIITSARRLCFHLGLYVCMFVCVLAQLYEHSNLRNS